MRPAHVLDLAADVLAVAVAGVLGVLEAHLRQHAADDDLLTGRQVGQVGDGVHGEALQHALVLGQRMAGEVEVERFLLVLELLGLGPFGHVGQRHVGGRGGAAVLGAAAEQAHLAGLAVALQVAGGLDGARQDVQQLRRGGRSGRRRRP